MNCSDVRQHWNLYHDSEGEAELHFQVGEHLAVCPDCAEWFCQQSRLEKRLAEKLQAPPPTPELWNWVHAGTGLKRPVPSRRQLLFVGLAACATVVGVALWFRFPFRSEPLADLARLTAQWHERLAEGQEAVQFRSQSDLEVEDYLRQRVSFPVRCPPRKDVGFTVQGAGVCTLGEQPAAYLLGRVEEAPVSIFILPRDGLAAFPHQYEAVRKESTHRCREGAYEMVLGVIDRNAVLVIGRTESERLARVLNAYGTYPEHH